MAGDTPLSVQLRGLMWLAITKRFRTQAQALGLRIMTAWFQEICNGRLLTPGLDWAKRAELPLTTEEDKVRAKVQTWRTWEKAAPRITSYNVCYTKLLRIPRLEGWRGPDHLF